MAEYASETTVPAESSRAEIERTLKRYGATAFAYAEQSGRAAIQFEMKQRRIRFVVPLPARSEFNQNRSGGSVAKTKGDQMHQKAVRQRWRAMALLIKAKLEAVESDIVTIEEEFLNQIVLPDGRTVGEFMQPQIEQAYTTGKMPPMLPGM